MGSREERRLPYLCECGDVGCERCVDATVEEFDAEILLAAGHEPAASVAGTDRQLRH